MKRIRRRNPGLSRIKTGPGRSAMCVDPVTPGCQLLPYSLFCFEYQCSFCLPLCYSVFYPWEGKKSRVRIEKLIKFQQTFWKILLKTVLNLQSLDLAGVELLQPFLCDSPDHKQLVRMIFKNVQCIQAEAVYNCFGCSRTDPLDESGGQIV